MSRVPPVIGHSFCSGFPARRNMTRRKSLPALRFGFYRPHRSPRGCQQKNKALQLTPFLKTESMQVDVQLRSKDRIERR